MKSEENINIKNCIVYDVQRVRNFVIAHKEPASQERKKRDLFTVNMDVCRDLIGPSSSISSFQKLSKTLANYNLPKPKFIPQIIKSDRVFVRSYIQSVVFPNEKRVNKGELGNCYGAGFKTETFPEFLKLYESLHQEIVKNTIALCLVADEGRGFLKFNLVFSTTKYQVNSKYSILLLIAEMKESITSIQAVLERLPLREIRKRADDLKVPLIFSGK